MALAIRRRWLWLPGGLALLAVLVYGVARLADEPLRRYMQAEVNRRLTGYTVQIGALHVHPWAASLDVRDAIIAQDAHPHPPIAQVSRLVTRIDWRALLQHRIVADISFERPTIHLNLTQVRTEATEATALKDRGWQQALEALALDLKINRLRVRDGAVTYVDRGPFKPLRISRVNLNAENIRNIASKEHVYPSPIHLEAAVFDEGSLWLDGRADFLAEPHVGVQAALRLDQVALDFFKPITERYNLAVRNGSLSLAGTVEYAPSITRLDLDQVRVHGVALEYRHLPHTAEAEKARVQQAAEAAKQIANTSSTELRIGRLDVVKSTLGFVNQAAKRAYRLQLTDADLSVAYLSNQRQDGTAVARLTGQLMGRGETRLTATLQPRTGGADMAVTAQIETADLARLKDLVRAYGGFEIKAGELSVYSELQMKGGAIAGYVKPLFRGVRIGSDGEAVAERGLRQRLYEGMVGIGSKVLKNRLYGEIATVAPISGRIDRPAVGRWETLGRLLQNAFLEPIEPGFEPQRTGRGRPAGKGSPEAPDGPASLTAPATAAQAP
ncbi:MAG: AsmA family protein [Candidatus Rokuibacteriota bacterium]